MGTQHFWGLFGGTQLREGNLSRRWPKQIFTLNSHKVGDCLIFCIIIFAHHFKSIRSRQKNEKSKKQENIEENLWLRFPFWPLHLTTNAKHESHHLFCRLTFLQFFTSLLWIENVPKMWFHLTNNKSFFWTVTVRSKYTEGVWLRRSSIWIYILYYKVTSLLQF